MKKKKKKKERKWYQSTNLKKQKKRERKLKRYPVYKSKLPDSYRVGIVEIATFRKMIDLQITVRKP